MNKVHPPPSFDLDVDVEIEEVVDEVEVEREDDLLTIEGKYPFRIK